MMELSPSIPQPHAMRAWALSFLVHGLAVLGATILVAQVKPTPVKEPFRWQVSQVETSHQETKAEEPPPQSVTPSPPPTPPTPMKQTAQKPAPQVAEVHRVETKPIVQAAQAIERPTTQPVTRETAAVQAEPPAPVVTQSVGAVAAMSRTAEVVTKNALAAAERTAVAREATAREATVHEATAVATTPVTATATEAPAITQTVQHAAVHRSIAQEAPVTQAIEHAPVQDSPIQEAKLRQDMPVHSTKPIEAQQSAPQPIVAEKAPAHAAPARKGDDRWLAEALIRRVNELQRYPTSARKNGWEGKVLLRVVIGADGHLAEVKVEQSSGYEALDNAAIETVRLACPIHLRHELTRPRVVFNIPLKYDLTN